MDTIFRNSENSETYDSQVLILYITVNQSISLSNVSIYYTWRNIKSSYNNNKFKTLAITWNDTFE